MTAALSVFLFFFALLVVIQMGKALPGRRVKEKLAHITNYRIDFPYSRTFPLLGAFGVCIGLIYFSFNLLVLSGKERSGAAEGFLLGGLLIEGWAVFQLLANQVFVSKSLNGKIVLDDGAPEKVKTSGLVMMAIRMALICGLLGLGLIITGLTLKLVS